MEVISDIRQRHLRDLTLELKRRQPEEWDSLEELPLFVYYDLYAQASLAAGWIEGEVTEEDIGNLTWEELRKLVEALLEANEKAIKIEKN